MTNFFDNLTATIQHFHDWDDLPPHLLPLVLTSEAAMLSGFEAGNLGCAEAGGTWAIPRA
jgi:hypothetical protein